MSAWHREDDAAASDAQEIIKGFDALRVGAAASKSLSPRGRGDDAATRARGRGGGVRARGRRGAATAPPPRRDTRNSPAQVVHTVALQTTASFVPDVPSHAARIERVEVLGLVDHEAAADAWAAAKKQLRKRCPGVVTRRVAVARGVKGREADFATAVRACYTLSASAPPSGSPPAESHLHPHNSGMSCRRAPPRCRK